MSAAAQLADNAVTLASIAAKPLWVAWQQQDRDDDKPPTKVPHNPVGVGLARADNPATWGTRQQAEARAAILPKPYGLGGIGIEFCELGDGRSLGGIDLDACRDPSTHVVEPWAAVVVEQFASYAEVSPSRTGLKVFFLFATADMPKLQATMGTKFGRQFKRGGGEHPPAIELHLGNRYFAVTGEGVDGGTDEFRQVETDTLLHLITEHGPAFAMDGDECGEARSPQAAPKKGRRAPTDRSRSATAMRKGKALRRDGADFERMVEGMLSDPQTAEWTREKGQANNQRELRRIWEKSEPKGRLIRVTVGELHLAADAAEQALIEAGLPIFQRGDVGLVQPVSRDVPASHGRMTVAAGLIDLNVHSATDHLCAVAEWERYDGRSEEWVRTNPPSPVVQILLHRHGRFNLPSVVGVITTPTMRRDGSLLTAPGYDPATRLYHVVEPGLRLHPAVHNPTRKDAESALRLLSELLAEFPFVSTTGANGEKLEVSKAVALSAIITAVVRGAMSVAPLHGFNAHAPGSGKSYMADVVSTITTGRPCPVIAAAADEAETEKRIAGLLLAGYPIVSLDNVNGELGGDLLCQAVERPLIRIRRLGVSDITEIESCVTMFATGNGLRVRGDMVRRSLIAELDPEMERPETRTFAGDPVATILADRSRYVSACLIIVRTYLLAGRPGLLPSIASFSHWSDMVRSALVWLGCADPALSMEAAREDDPELTELREVMEAWHEAIGPEPKTIRAAAEVAGRSVAKGDENGDHHRGYAPAELQWPALHDVFTRIAGSRGGFDTHRLGKWMLGKGGRIVGGRRFQKDGATHGVARWKLSQVPPKVLR